MFKKPCIVLNYINIFPYSEEILRLITDFAYNAVHNAQNINNNEIIILIQKNNNSDVFNTSNLYNYGIIATIEKYENNKIHIHLSSKIKFANLEINNNCYYCEIINEKPEKITNNQFNAFKSFLIDKINSLKSKFESFAFNINNCLLNNYTHEETIFKILQIIVKNDKLSDNIQDIILNYSLVDLITFICEKIVEKIEEAKIYDKIQYITNQNLNKKQTEFILREKINAIKSELGDNNDSLLIDIQNAKLPKDIEDIIMKEYNKLSNLPNFSLESSIITNYIKLCIELPWNKSKKLNEDLKIAKEILDKTHYGMKEVKDEIIEQLSINNRTSKPTGILLVGAPGVGKSTICDAIAEATGRKKIRISMGSISDPARFQGHMRSYVGAIPGIIISKLKQVKYNNPIIQIDEIDKFYNHKNMQYVLIDILDPELNSKFEDSYLSIPFDLSKVLFILTANSIDQIPNEILNRVKVIHIDGYTIKEKFHIAKIIIERKFKELKITDEISFSDSAIYKIINEYTNENGARELDRKITEIIRKCIIKNPKEHYHITDSKVEKMLGMSEYLLQNRFHNEIGVCNGLAYTSLGGKITKLEVSAYPGDGKIEITGNLGKVMEESVKMVINYIKSNLKHLKINLKFFTENNICFHAQEGGIPKDGPSAGIAIFSALYSLIKNKPIKSDIAMTGEMSLSGNILAIGGLKEKLSGAIRNKIKKVIIPKENEYIQLPDDIKKDLEIIYISKINEVIHHLF